MLSVKGQPPNIPPLQQLKGKNLVRMLELYENIFVRKLIISVWSNLAMTTKLFSSLTASRNTTSTSTWTQLVYQ
jgi:hypothetical protein